MRNNKILSAVIAFVLAGAFAVGVCCMGFASRNADGKWFGNFKELSTWHWFDKTDENKPNVPELPDNPDKPNDSDNSSGINGAIISGIENQGINLMVAEIPVSAYEANGIAPQAENAYSLTAEVKPDYASDKTVNWSVAWQDTSSAFASGKNVANYVTITPSSDGATTAVLACMQDFGEPIVLTVSSRSNPSVCGVAIVHYYQRIKSINYSIKLDGEAVSSSADSNGVYKVDYTGAEKEYVVELNPVYSAYTLTDNFTTSISGKLSSTFGYTATTNLNSPVIPAGLSGGEPEMSSVLSNWCKSVELLPTVTDGYGFKNMVATLKKHYNFSSEDFNHPRYKVYNEALNTISSNSASVTTAFVTKINSYAPAAYYYCGASVSDYNSFVSAVKACNSAGTGVIQYTIEVTGTYSTYSTVLNLSYNDEFKIDVQDINLSDTFIAF